MLKSRFLITTSLAVLVVSAIIPQNADAIQFDIIDPNLNQEIFTGPIDSLGWGPGMAWTSDGNLLLRGDNLIQEYSLTADTLYNGTNVHSIIATHNLAGSNLGYGMTNGLDGFVYAQTDSGIAQIDTTSWTSSILAGSNPGFYGIETLTDGRIVHAGNDQNIYILDPTTGIDTWIYDPGDPFVDGIAVSPTSEIFIATLGTDSLQVINTDGILINSTSLTHPADGMAFGNGSVYANNIDGTVTRIDFAGPGFTGAATEVVVAQHNPAGWSWGDLASAGPDGSFYVSQWLETTWDDGTTTNEASIIRLSFDTATGGGFCSGAGCTTQPVPEPATLFMLSGGLAILFAVKRKK